MSEMKEMETTATEQTTEEFANALDELTTVNEDEESEESRISLWEVGKNVQAVRQTAKDVYNFCTWIKKNADARIERAEERKQKREEAKQKIKLKNPFSKKQTEETPESTEEKSVEIHPLESMTNEQLAALLQEIQTQIKVNTIREESAKQIAELQKK